MASSSWKSKMFGMLVLLGCGAAAHAGDAPRIDISRAGVSWEWTQRTEMPHGIAGAEDLVFITEPMVGRVVALDRVTGREVGEVTPPPGEGFLLPFTLRVPEEGRLVVLDAGGFPNPFFPAVPRVYDVEYTWNRRTRTLSTQIVRTVRFDGYPVVYSEDLEVLSDGTYVMSESVIGGLWVINPDGSILPGMFPSTPAPIPAIGACPLPPFSTGGIPFGPAFGPGVGSMASKDGWLYFSTTCLGGLHKVPVATLLDQTRTGEQKAADIVTISPREGVAETLKGLAFDRWNPSSRWLWATNPLDLEMIRIDIHTGRRELVSDNGLLFNFAVAAAFLPPRYPGIGTRELVVSSDQEHRFSGINTNLTEDQFQPPFRLTRILTNPRD
ncbi:MAG: hypothetical protein WBV82_09645 [Myxococcaceae bacterium]